MNAAVGGKVDILVVCNEIGIGVSHKGFKFRTGAFKRNKAVSPVVAVNYGVLGKGAASEFCGTGCPGHASVGVIVGVTFSLPYRSVLDVGSLNGKMCRNGFN